jgi:hypothetical protein
MKHIFNFKNDDMKKIKVKYAGIIFAIVLILANHSLHVHHTEEIKDDRLTKIMNLFRTYYGEGIGINNL